VTLIRNACSGPRDRGRTPDIPCRSRIPRTDRTCCCPCADLDERSPGRCCVILTRMKPKMVLLGHFFGPRRPEGPTLPLGPSAGRFLHLAVRRPRALAGNRDAREDAVAVGPQVGAPPLTVVFGLWCSGQRLERAERQLVVELVEHVLQDLLLGPVAGVPDAVRRRSVEGCGRGGRKVQDGLHRHG
jgi:hypothetical protein